MSQEQIPAPGSSPHVSPALELTESLCGLFVSCTNRESKYSGAKSQAFCWASAEGSCDKHCKGKIPISEILAKAAANHTVSSSHPGRWSQSGCCGGSPPCRTTSPTGFGVAMGMSQHPCPHTGLHIAQAAGLCSRSWVLVCKF